MAVRNVIRHLAESSGKTEAEYLSELLNQCGHEQKTIARVLKVSQSAVSQALERNNFKRVQRYIREQAS